MKKAFVTAFLLCIITAAIAQENIIKNPQFDDGKKYWTLKKENNAAATVDYPADLLLSGAASCQVAITVGGDKSTDVYMQQSLTLEEGKAYTISFMARADVPHTIQAIFKETETLQRTFWASPELALENKPTHYGPYAFNCNLGAAITLRLLMGGQDNVHVRLDSVWVTAEERPGYVCTVDKFLKRSHTFDGTTLPYRLCMPDFYDPAQKYPLVLALHGVGECGTDDQIHIDVHRMATSWADSANQKKYPCFVVAPQCPLDNRWVDADWTPGFYRVSNTPESNELLSVIDLVDSLIREFPVDTNRLYVTGLSMGGQGTWDIITRYPDKFAAAIPMSGGGDSTRIQRIKHLPIWAFHGELDSTVPVSGSRQMITALEHTGRQAVYTHCHEGDCTGKTDEEVAAEIQAGATLLYTEWKGKNHVMWAESYDYPNLFPWVFAQNKQNNAPAVAVEQNKESLPENLSLKQNYPNPFNPATQIEFALQHASNVKIDIYDLLGRQVLVLFDGRLNAGRHQMTFQAAGLPSGKYIYQINADEFTECQIMTLQK
jgi:predicted peptidase